MGYYSDCSEAYEGQESLLTLKQLIAGEGGDSAHEDIFRYLMGWSFGANYRDRRAGQMFLLVAPPLMRVVGAWDCYQWETEYCLRVGLPIDKIIPPLTIVSMLSAVDGAAPSPYMLQILSRGMQEQDKVILNVEAIYSNPIWVAYQQVVENRSLALTYITRELRYSDHASTTIHNLVMGQLYV